MTLDTNAPNVSLSLTLSPGSTRINAHMARSMWGSVPALAPWLEEVEACWLVPISAGDSVVRSLVCLSSRRTPRIVPALSSRPHQVVTAFVSAMHSLQEDPPVPGGAGTLIGADGGFGDDQTPELDHICGPKLCAARSWQASRESYPESSQELSQSGFLKATYCIPLGESKKLALLHCYSPAGIALATIRSLDSLVLRQVQVTSREQSD